MAVVVTTADANTSANGSTVSQASISISLVSPPSFSTQSQSTDCDSAEAVEYAQRVLPEYSQPSAAASQEDAVAQAAAETPLATSTQLPAALNTEPATDRPSDV